MRALVARLRSEPTQYAHVATLAVVVTSWLSVVLSPTGRSAIELANLTALHLLYGVIGTYGWDVVDRTQSDLRRGVYFGVQLALGWALLQWTQGLSWVLLLPLPAHAVGVSPRWVVGVSVAVLAAVVVPAAMVRPWHEVVQLATASAASIVFVVIFTALTMRAERLAAELRQANEKLRAFAAQAEELATARERNRLAREIHDSLGHYLTVINIQIQAAQALLESDRERAADALYKAQRLAEDGLGDVRRSVAALRSSPVEQRPLPEAVADLAEQARASGVDTSFELRGDPRPVTVQVEHTLYRAVQEALTNIRKHAAASHAKLLLEYGDDSTVRVIVEDDGQGSDSTAGGFGLLGLRERVQLLGGHVRTRTAAGEGFTLELRVPG